MPTFTLRPNPASSAKTGTTGKPKYSTTTWHEKDPSIVSGYVRRALVDAMKIEKVPVDQYRDLLWLIAQESEGVVDARNKSSTARGLFQLLRAQYNLNLNGEKSFGNPVEECQGGIRYVMKRYRSASAARCRATVR